MSLGNTLGLVVSAIISVTGGFLQTAPQLPTCLQPGTLVGDCKGKSDFIFNEVIFVSLRGGGVGFNAFDFLI